MCKLKYDELNRFLRATRLLDDLQNKHKLVRAMKRM